MAKKRPNTPWADFWYGMDEQHQQRFADQVGSQVVWLYHLSRGYKKPSKRLAKRIEEATFGVVKAADGFKERANGITSTTGIGTAEERPAHSA